MNKLNPTEMKFENNIEKYLNLIEYKSIHYKLYDRNLCLIKDEVLDFIKKTQKDSWQKLQNIYGDDTENKVLFRISSEISRRGAIDVFRNQVSDRGVYLDLCYFEPKSDLNPDHINLFKLNQFSLVRQLHYSTQNENSIDMVLLLNGIPIVTMELKNQLTGQNYKHSENQYRYTRDPKEPFLQFKRVLVHFCVDNNQVSMTTRLNGTKTRFFPYNKSIENPPVDNDYRSSYLWKEILNLNSLLDIIENFSHVSNEKEYYFNEQEYNFSGTVSAMGYSPIDPSYRYVLTENGKFYYSLDNGENWIMTSSFTGPGAHYFYGSTIWASSQELGKVFIGGSGYSNSPVYVSENHGQTFTAMDNGLPHTLVFQLAGTPDDAVLFAATEIGPYAYSRNEDEWFLLTGVSAPDQTYWTVDYIPEINTARFGTYGRGIWDFVLNENYQNYLGDVNNDLIVNIQDVILVISFILGNNIPTTQEFINSDLNEDNQINILDIVMIVDIIFDS